MSVMKDRRLGPLLAANRRMTLYSGPAAAFNDRQCEIPTRCCRSIICKADVEGDTRCSVWRLPDQHCSCEPLGQVVRIALRLCIARWSGGGIPFVYGSALRESHRASGCGDG